MKHKQILITGGAGFIGVNAAQLFLQEGWHVTVLDNLSRRGGALNLDWLRGQGTVEFQKVDIRDQAALEAAFAGRRYDYVLHCAGQVAVTTSVSNPREDFECNALGTFNVLEAVRRHCPEAFFLYTSTNKVYGGMEHLKIVERNGRYEYGDLPEGVDESAPLDFHSPYGCSKGAADQYVRDYSRIYGLATVCFRQSCIYGYRQFGIEDQGWVAWFTIAHALGQKITIFGDGKQTRDVLFIEDLVQAYKLAFDNREKLSGQVYNIGGGPRNQLSLLELIDMLEKLRGRAITPTFADWRPGDQRVFVADIQKAHRDFGWQPVHDCRAGVAKLIGWVDAHRSLFM